MQGAGAIQSERINGHHRRDEDPNPSEYWMHTHNGLELFYFISGSAHYRVEATVYPLQPGDILIMRTAETHSLLVDEAVPYERIAIHFSPELLTETLNARLLVPFNDRPLGMQNRYAAQELPGDFVRLCLERLLSCRPEDGESGLLVYLLPLLQELYTVWQRRSPETEADVPPPLAVQLVAYINQHLGDLDDLHQLEKQFFLSQSQINRIFRRFTGTSVWEYVQLKRLFAARQLLRQGMLPCKAAASCGYREYSTFYRAYKKRFGHAPQQDQGAPAGSPYEEA